MNIMKVCIQIAAIYAIKEVWVSTSCSISDEQDDQEDQDDQDDQEGNEEYEGENDDEMVEEDFEDDDVSKQWCIRTKFYSSKLDNFDWIIFWLIFFDFHFPIYRKKNQP